jgi:hypothetical protein
LKEAGKRDKNIIERECKGGGKGRRWVRGPRGEEAGVGSESMGEDGTGVSFTYHLNVDLEGRTDHNRVLLR